MYIYMTFSYDRKQIYCQAKVFVSEGTKQKVNFGGPAELVLKTDS